MLHRPRGIVAVAILTLLGGGCFFFYATVVTALGSMGHAGTYTDPAAAFRLQTLIFPPMALSLLSIISADGVLMKHKLGWYSSILLWILSITYLMYAAATWFLVPAPTGSLLIILVIFVNMVFIAYFQSREVRSYFDQKTENGA